MNVTAQQIADRISEICTLFGFRYHGKDYGVDPFSYDRFALYAPDDNLTVHSIDEVMNTPFFDGKCLNDIVGDIEITEGL